MSMLNFYHPLAAGSVAAALLLASGGAGATCRADSGPNTATLVELYTSEGCDSCPPADRWLSSLGKAEGIVALAFHVDYWDRLGWRDPFASPAFTARQQDRSRSSGARFLYTPQVIVGGRDFSGWRGVREAATLRRPTTAGANIRLEAVRGNDGRITWKLEARQHDRRPGESAVAWLALHANGLTSEVRAGENAGKRLTHDFVVREWRGPFPLAADGRLTQQGEFRPADPATAATGLAAIVESVDGGRVLQALNLPLSEPSCATAGTVESTFHASPPSPR